MGRDMIIFITDDLRPYLSVLESGLASLVRQAKDPFFQWPAKAIGHKPSFARITLSEKSEKHLDDLKGKGHDEADLVHAGLCLAKKERRDTKERFRQF